MHHKAHIKNSRQIESNEIHSHEKEDGRKEEGHKLTRQEILPNDISIADEGKVPVAANQHFDQLQHGQNRQERDDKERIMLCFFWKQQRFMIENPQNASIKNTMASSDFFIDELTP